MARLLAIDWDHDQLRVVAAGMSRKGAAVEKTFSLPLTEELTSSNGEALGRKLRDALRDAGIAPAPIVGCVSRDRVVIKELRYPPVPASEEPALVRFQAAKELSEQPDDVVIDYSTLTPANQSGERHALAVALKKQTKSAWDALARGVGVKLAGLTTRPQATLGAVARSQSEGRTTAADTIAVLAIGARWAELSIQNKGRMLFSRSLALGHNLIGEIKRNLHVFAATNAAVAAPSFLLLTGKPETDLERRLSESLGLPVQTLDPLHNGEATAIAERGIWSGAIGAAHLWARTESLAINFAAPKQARVAVDISKRRKVGLAIVVAVVVLAVFIGGQVMLNNQLNVVSSLRDEKTRVETSYKNMNQLKLDVDALKDWEDTSVSWLDELYDLAARFPIEIGLRVKELSVQANTKRGAKDAHVGNINFTLIAKPSQEEHVNKLLSAINGDKHLKATIAVRTLSDGNQEYQFKVDVAKQARYATRLSAPPRLAAPAAVEAPDADAETEEKGGGQ